MFGRRVITLAALAALTAASLTSPGLAQTNSKEIMALPPDQLVELLQKADAPVFEKAKACQRLAVVGTADAIPALVALLPDQHLNLYARYGLEGIQDPAVDEALRNAARSLQGRQLVGVIDSIGQRQDAQAVGVLKQLLTNDDRTVASAAAGALGRIGTAEAAVVLKTALSGDTPVKNCVADGCLACEGLSASGKQDESAALYEAVTQSDVPKHLRIAAVAGLLRLGTDSVKDVLLAQIRAEDEGFFEQGLAAARRLPGDDVTQALVEQMDQLPAPRRALLLMALGGRQDKAPMNVVLKAIKSESGAVRAAAVQVLCGYADEAALAALLDAALSDDAVAASAREGLANLSGEQGDQAIVARLSEVDGKAKTVLLELAGMRGAAAALPAVRQALTDADAMVKLAALDALGRLAGLDDFDLLASRALGATTAEAAAAKEALRTAALRAADRDACAAKLATSLAGASAEDQDFLFTVLGQVSGPKALQIVVEAAKSNDEAAKDSATRVLGEWPNPEAADALLELAKSELKQGEKKYGYRVLRGYIRIATQMQLPRKTKLEMFETAMAIATRDDDRKVALRILSRIPSRDTLRIAASYVDNPDLRGEAAHEAVAIATTLVDTQPKAVAEAMQKVVDAGITGDDGIRAKQLLRRTKGR